MDMENNKHATETAWSSRYHYKGNVCCGHQDGPDHVTLKCKPRGYPTLDFEIPRQRYELDKIDNMMEYAYGQGQLHRSQEIGRMMKSVISL